MPSFPSQWIHGSHSCRDNTDPPIQTHAYDPDTYILRQSKCVEPKTSFEAPFVYLLFGEERALLLDTGATRSEELFPLARTVRRLIRQWLAARGRDAIPLLVCHTHNHGDHVAGDPQFSDWASTHVVPPTVEEVQRFFGIADWPHQIAPLHLGGRTLDVLAIPGHEEAHVALYDRSTRLLFTGDSLYPGLLVVRDWEAFRQSIARLVDFTERNDLSYILGGHIEMKCTPGRWFGYPALYQPDEHVLQLEARHLLELHKALQEGGPRTERHDDFILHAVEGPMPPADD